MLQLLIFSPACCLSFLSDHGVSQTLYDGEKQEIWSKFLFQEKLVFCSGTGLEFFPPWNHVTMFLFLWFDCKKAQNKLCQSLLTSVQNLTALIQELGLTLELIFFFLLSISLPVFLIVWFYNIYRSVQSLSHVRLVVTPWTAARQASLSITNSQNLLKLSPSIR